MSDELHLRIHGDSSRPTLIYLPGAHGDWTLAGPFRTALAGRVRLVEVVYPRTLRWTIHDYGREIAAHLAAHGIRGGWLLGESFGSQVAWKLLEPNATNLSIEGLILAGGFVKYFWKPGPFLFRLMGQCIPMWLHTRTLRKYGQWSERRHRDNPETLGQIREFIARRTLADRLAMRHRLRLISGHDPRAIARQARVPIYYLSGAWDILVPYPPVRRWLRKNCPAFRGDRIVPGADHTVLFTAPRVSADQICAWMGLSRPSALLS